MDGVSKVVQYRRLKRPIAIDFKKSQRNPDPFRVLWVNDFHYTIGSTNFKCNSFVQLWPTLSHPWFPLLIMFICSYQIANCFLSVYEMAIDTIMLCCAEELVLLRDNPEMAQQFRVSLFKSVQIGCTLCPRRHFASIPLVVVDNVRGGCRCSRIKGHEGRPRERGRGGRAFYPLGPLARPPRESSR